ncbi:MarR family transcriptional regulator [Streptomyces sp. NPDC050145]|uniref:MarR family transcriptional regulator n=1 Tax=Streptomyces sp. NPDC050145 TaxID=3365602 RepID=UPI003788E99B
MAEPARQFFALVDAQTGEMTEAGEPEDSGGRQQVVRDPYGFDGPHINVGIRRGRALASAASGLTDREFRVLVWYWFATEQSQGAPMMTRADIAKELGMSPDTLSRTVKILHGARLLVAAGGIGRTTFYRCTPYLAFIGSGFAHRTAVKDWNPPETEIREPRSKTRGRSGKNGSGAASKAPVAKGDHS